MTIDEAITHCNEISAKCVLEDGNRKCAEEHAQLAEWLLDYLKLKKQTKHAHWIDTPYEWRCSNCGKEYWSMNHWFNFCPECGAKMDEVTK